MQPNNGSNLGPSLEFNGTYTENGETKPIQCFFKVGSDGAFTGRTKDDDGWAECEGKIYFPSGANSGTIAWLETRKQKAKSVLDFDLCVETTVLMETTGTLSKGWNSWNMQASYTSTFENTEGVLNMSAPIGGGFAQPIQDAFATAASFFPGFQQGQNLVPPPPPHPPPRAKFRGVSTLDDPSPGGQMSYPSTYVMPTPIATTATPLAYSYTTAAPASVVQQAPKRVPMSVALPAPPTQAAAGVNYTVLQTQGS